MSEEAVAATGGEAVAPASLPEELSVHDAGRIWAERLAGNNSAAPAAPEKAAEVETPTESADEADTTPDEGTIVEDQGDEPELPAIDPPRSWSKDAHERWAKLDRETQEYLVARDSEDQKAIKRSLNEAAEQRKAVEAEKKAIEVERERYLKAVSSDIESKEAEIANRFTHIKSMADVNFLAQRALELANTGNPDDMTASQQVQAYIQAWNDAQTDLAVLKANKAEADQRQTKEEQTRRTSYEQEQNLRLAELVPEMKDEAKETALRDKAIKMLTDDLTRETLAEWWGTKTGHEILTHASIQKLIVDGLRYRELQKAPPKAATKPVPPVQKPGIAQNVGDSASERIRTLQKQFERDPTVENATALRLARSRR